MKINKNYGKSIFLISTDTRGYPRLLKKFSGICLTVIRAGNKWKQGQYLSDKTTSR